MNALVQTSGLEVFPSLVAVEEIGAHVGALDLEREMVAYQTRI